MAEFQRIGADLGAAIDHTDAMVGLSESPTVEQPDEHVPTAAENDQALAELRRMMGNI